MLLANENVINKKILENVPGSVKSTIKVSQSPKRGFSQKALSEIKKIFLFWHGMNLSKAWNIELEAGIFLAI